MNLLKYLIPPPVLTFRAGWRRKAMVVVHFPYALAFAVWSTIVAARHCWKSA